MFGAPGLVNEAYLVGVVLGESVGYVESHTRRSDGADFEVIECQQWRFGLAGYCEDRDRKVWASCEYIYYGQVKKLRSSNGHSFLCFEQ